MNDAFKPAMNRLGSDCITSLLLLSCLSFGTGATAGGADWYYTLGEQRENQQGNFCLTEEDASELANIFRKYGVRPGFAALSGSPNCGMRVNTFTPHEVVEIIQVKQGDENKYTIRFLRVEMEDGDRRFLITTRDVRESD